MKLCHNDQWSCQHLWHDLWPRRCHIEVTRVKKVNLAKSLLLQLKWYCHVIHAYGSLNLSLFRLYTKKYPRSFGITRSNKGQILITSNGKTNGANMLALVKHAKVSTVTSPSDLQFRGQRSKRSNIKQHRMAKLAVPTCWPGQQRSNFKQRQSAKLLVLDKHAKVSTVTSLSDLWLRGQRSYTVKF